MKSFNLSESRSIEITDRSELEPLLNDLHPETCELNFFNLFTWSLGYRTLYQMWQGLPYFYFQSEDKMLFPGGNNQARHPRPEDLAVVSDHLISLGKSGTIWLAPECYLQTPGLSDYFEAVQVTDDYGEYIHETVHLAELHGSKLGKKRNLIAQFERNHPDYKVVPLTAELIPECRKLDKRWSDMKWTEHAEHTDAIADETRAQERMWEYYSRLNTQGYCLFADGKLVAFSLFDQENPEMTVEHYEKTDSEYKGAAQMINHESALALCGKYRYINREQDLGFEGLRHAKMSYAPDKILLNWNLIRKK